MYAIIEDSGSQIKVAPGDVIDVDLREITSKTKKVKFDRVLLVGDAEADESANIGTPYIKGASVSAEVLEEIRAEKIDVIKYKRRKGYKRKRGHRQRYLRVKITDIKS
ncbi:MAG: 50S ribosomal protein L21 [Planctomycetes bacterium]|nr:50S ribosomal protein L21 [Planctomycetota bacterium]